MSLPARVLAVPIALLLLAGCRNKPAPAVKPAPNSAPTSTVARPPIEADPLAQLRPHLAEALSKVRAAAGPMGLLGWPGVVALDGSDGPDRPDESNPTMERLFFHNDRALIFVDKITDRYSAFVLMPESKSKEELHYWPVWVWDLFGSPKVERVSFENTERNKFDGSDGVWWEGGDSVKRKGPQTEEETRLYAEEPFLLLAGTRDSDAPMPYLAGATPTILDSLEGVTDAQGLIEGYSADAQPNMDRTLPHKDLQMAQKLGETKRFMWFAIGEKKYATEKSNWEAWMKGPQPSTIKDQAP